MTSHRWRPDPATRFHSQRRYWARWAPRAHNPTNPAEKISFAWPLLDKGLRFDQPRADCSIAPWSRPIPSCNRFRREQLMQCAQFQTSLQEPVMRAFARYSIAAILCTAVAMAVAEDSGPTTSPLKYESKVPGGLSFSEFKGYESWEMVALSQNARYVSVIVANPSLINAYKSGVPANGKVFPDGAMFAKIHWIPKKSTTSPGQPTVPGALHDVDFMVKDSKRF